ncbi:family 78 glycoside hydrolase catalytic domain [Actinoallomurus rhizosphaericola]|uniref:family 78 glycoside hydrolase catalytic domain n=1 Tax=Actinoallomurus rhizosphaericola TaxID=2952536 RepID=UPI0020935C81|nr:family 78 glycoside hydrolase catalytic domain [Actinoallomurus rhizosphaericola]MCO5997272.1 glycoside hydrolase family 78 protein [Actinoallomurus rhizosphaericola]
MSTTPLRRISAVAAIVAACGTATAVPAFAAADPAVTGLRAGDLSDRLGIEDTTPPLTWQLTNSGTDVTQNAYQIQAATSADGFAHADLWDTGRVASADQRVDYAGKALGSRTRVYWRVRVWTTHGGVSDWSDPVWFETGLTSAKDWSGQWITHPDWRFKEKRPDPIVVKLPETTARYVRLNVTKLGLPLVENLPDKTYRLQLAELEVRDSAGANLAANTTVTSNDTGNQVNHKYLPKYLTDGTETTDQELAGWSSSAHTSDDVSAKPITLTVDLKSAKTFDQVLLFPRTDVPAAGDKVPFAPVDYSVSTADDVGGTFTTQKTVTGQEPPRSPVPEAMPIFAKDFSLPSGIRSARLYVAGEGVYEAALNGRQVGDAVLEPGNTDVTDQVPYATYDVTKLLREGDNAISMKLGNGTANVISTVDRYRKFALTQSDPELIAQLEVTLADGSVRRIVSGTDWQTTLGGTTFSNWYGGEDFDARREPTGWERPGAKRDGWGQAIAVPGPGGALTGRLQEPVRVQETLQGAKVGSGNGYQVFDLGRNIAGWPELTIQAPAGTTVRMYPSESLTNGRANQSTSNVGAPIWDEYTTGSDGTETWHPHFSYHALRYVELRGVPDGATVSVRGLAMHADNASAGSFSSSNDVINGIHTLIRRAIENNTQSILTDCPSREKLGWLEQDHLVYGSLVDNYDLAAQLRKVVRDMAEAQTDTGLIPSTVPDYTVLAGAYRDDPNWGGAFVVVPWNLYQTYGDADTMATYYPAMQKYASYLEARAVGGLTDYSLGDWYTPDRTFPKYVSGTYGYWRVLDTMSKIAGALGKTDDAAAYRAKADASAKALADKYYDPNTGTFAGGGQGAEALALDMGAVPSDQRQRLLDHLVAGIQAAGYHLLLGEISLPSVFRVLPDDVIYKIATQTTSPSLGYQVVHGNTTLGESWDGGSGQSQDHFMLGSIDAWFTSNLAGIRQAPGSTGFRRLLIAPSVVGDLTRAEGRYRTPFGEARSEWTKADDGGIRLKVTVPPGSSAEVHVPGSGEVRQVGSGVWVFHSK